MPATAPGRATGTALVVGIDIGGTGTRFVATAPSTDRTLARRTVATPHTGSQDDIADFLRTHVDAVTGGQPPAAIGIGASGPVDAAGTVRNPDTLPAFTGLPVLDLLAGLTTGPRVIDNDAVCAALAEHHVGAARGAPRTLHVTLGTGVGVCLLDGDRPFRHADGTHPEAGHLTVAAPTRPCYCGRAACWEQAASRQALQRTAAALLQRPAADPTVLAELATRASRGDAEARAAFDDYGQRVADGLGTLLTVYGPSIVVLGGSATRHLELYRPSIRTSLARLGGWVPAADLLQTALDDDGGAIGAARLATLALGSSSGQAAALS